MTVLDLTLTSFKRKTRTWNIWKLIKIKRMKYWDQFLTLLFKYPTRCYQRKSPLEIDKIRNPSPNMKYFSDHFGRFSTTRSLIGVVSSNPEDLALTQHLLRIVYEEIKSPKVAELATAEILAKVLAYRTLCENDRIFIPTRTTSEALEWVEYTVDTVFDLWRKHQAFGLLPVSNALASPFILFRGTDFSPFSEGGRASILSDLDPDGPGKKLFLTSRSSLCQWLIQMSHLTQKPRVIGHSLGGVLAFYTALYEHSYLSKDPLKPSYSFNPPGVAETVVNEWNEIVFSEKPTFLSFITRGDLISKFGSLSGECFEAFTHKLLPPVIAHEQLIFSQPVSYLAKIDIIKENKTRSRNYYSTIQKQTTSLAYKFGLRFLLPTTSSD